MKIVIRDAATLELIQPGDAEAYLRAHDWRRVMVREREYSVWELPSGQGGTGRAIVSLDREFVDYPERTYELLNAIAEVEKRSQLAVYDDVLRIRLDGIAVRSEHPGTPDGSIPAYEGARLVENAVEMVEAAACSTVEPKPRFMARRPKQANEYVDRLRMGQTGRGSYVVNIYSPLQIPSDPVLPGQLALFDRDAPQIEGFGRRAVTTLARALQATKLAADRSVTIGADDPFFDADTVKQGVSANLLGAVVGMMGDDSERLEVSIRWSPFLPLRQKLPVSVTFERVEVEAVERAVERFRQDAPDEDVVLQGHVVQLNRTSDLFGDRIFLETLVNDRKARVALTVYNDNYKKAMQALEERKELRCRGILVKFGRSYRLDEVRVVEIVA